jgi:TolB protein
LFCSRGKIGTIDLKTGQEEYLELYVRNQVRWQPGPAFSDGERIILWSQEPPRNARADFGDKDSIAFARTRLWIHNVLTGTLDEIRLPTLMTVVGLLKGEERLLVSGNRDRMMVLMTADLEGSDQVILRNEGGYGYGTSLSPDCRRAAYHVTGVPGRNPYEVFTIDIETGERVLLASDPEYLSFGTQWSPDGRWVLYQRCAFRQDPGHDRCDLFISRADGSERRALTKGQSHWFATSYGSPTTRGGGSNMSRWSPDGGAITYSRLLPGSRTAWQYQAGRPDRDHFNREYRPDEAGGGTDICLVNPDTGDVTAITNHDPPIWNFRTEWSHDSKLISFSRSAIGQPSGVWVMNADGSGQRMLTRGLGGLGADFARFCRLARGRSFTERTA